MACIRGGWEGVGWVGRGGVGGGEGGQLEVGYTFHWDTGSSAVLSTSDKNRHSVKGRPRWLLAAVWHPMHPY